MADPSIWQLFSYPYPSGIPTGLLDQVYCDGNHKLIEKLICSGSLRELMSYGASTLTMLIGVLYIMQMWSSGYGPGVRVLGQ